MFNKLKSGTFSLPALLQVLIDCIAIAESGSQGEATGITLAPSQPQAVVTTGSGGVNVGNKGTSSTQEVINLIASRYFLVNNPSTKEELNGFLEYMEKVRKVIVVDVKSGSLIITVECSSVQILDELWEDYFTGHLNEMAQKFLVTEDILKELGLIAIKLKTTILREEYRACREYLLQRPGRCDKIYIFLRFEFHTVAGKNASRATKACDRYDLISLVLFYRKEQQKQPNGPSWTKNTY